LGRTHSLESIRINGRDYRWPERPLVVVCLDGSSFDYIEAASTVGLTPYLDSLIAAGNIRKVQAAMPTFTNPNNVSIVTGIPPAYHGISGNFYLERGSLNATMMNDPSLLRAETILAAFSREGAKVAVVTAKDKLRRLLAYGLNGTCISAEQEGVPIYSATLSEHVFKKALALLKSDRPDLMYLSTSDYVQHLHPPGSREANEFYRMIDSNLSEFHVNDVMLVITADHGMNSKTNAAGEPCVIFLQTLLDGWFGKHSSTVILPITDPYVAHHGSLGSFACIYLRNRELITQLISRLSEVTGIELVLDGDAADTQLELPADRIGDVVVCADRQSVLGTRREDHDLSQLTHPLRSHGALAEREVPMLFNRPLPTDAAAESLHNYDAFWIGLNLIQ
jgi:phosphonoacetate hydrolase